MKADLNWVLQHLKECADNNRYFEVPPEQAKMLLDAVVFSTVHTGNLAAVQGHRACGSVEHDPLNGKLHGYCVVCLVPWPCETAQAFLRKPQS